MSHDNYTAIRRFIVRHIQDQDFPENDGLPGRVLINLCLERFYPDLEDPEAIKTEKKSIEGAIRRMVEDSMLQPVNKNQKVVFRLDPYFNIKDKMNATASQPSEDPQSTQEALEALEKETSSDMEDQDAGQQMDEELDQQLAQQLDELMNQMEDQAEEAVQAGKQQGGWVKKVDDNQTEIQEDHQMQGAADNREDRQQLDQREDDDIEQAHTRHQPRLAESLDNQAQGQHRDQVEGDMGSPAVPHKVNQVAKEVDILAGKQQEAEQAARIEATRHAHAEAYAEIIRRAAPMPQTHTEEEEEDEDPIKTPGRKRRKVLEITASDTSSILDPRSPGIYPNSTPRQTMNRLGTPLSASRRHSAPTGICNSPSKHRSTRQKEHMIFKEERVDNSPKWLKDAVDDLQGRNPDSSITTENGWVKCLDCDGKTFRPTASRSIHGVMTHLRSKTHLVNITRNASRCQEKLGPSNYYFPTTIPTMDFNMPQAPLLVFANQRAEPQQDLESMFAAIGRSLRNDAAQRQIRTSFLDGRVQEMEKTNTEQQERITASLAAFERQMAEQQKMVSDILASSDEKQKELSREANDRISSVQEKSRQQSQKTDARMTTFEEGSKGQFEHISTVLARSDQRNIYKIEDIAECVNESQKSSEDRDARLSGEIRDLKEINEGQNVMIRELDSQVAETTKHLESLVEAQNNKIQVVQSQLGKSTREVGDYQKVVEAQNHDIRILRSQVGESTQRMNDLEKMVKAQKETICEIVAEKARDLEKIVERRDEKIRELVAEKTRAIHKRIEAQEESIHDLEAECQLLNEARQRQEKAIADQMTAHFQQTKKQMEDIKKYTAEKLQNITEQLTASFEKRNAEQAAAFEKSRAEQAKVIRQQAAWMQTFKEEMQSFRKETSCKIKSLDHSKKYREEFEENIGQVITSVCEDFGGRLGELEQDTGRPTATKLAASPVKTRVSI